jgi:Domain of unknown function (DUF4386)
LPATRPSMPCFNRDWPLFVARTFTKQGVSVTVGSRKIVAQSHEAMESNNKIARTAGALYLLVVVTGIFSLLYVPSQIFVRGNALATATNILASESLFRLGIAIGLISSAAFLLLPFALYRLLEGVDRNVAVLMVVLAVVSVPIAFVSQAHYLDALTLLSGADYLRAFSTDQLHAMVSLSLKAAGNETIVSELFWGLWLLPFGYLVFKSGFLPRFLGILLMIGCFGYLTEAFGRILFPADYAASGISSLIIIPSALGEVGTCLWLLIKGVRT